MKYLLIVLALFSVVALKAQQTDSAKKKMSDSLFNAWAQKEKNTVGKPYPAFKNIGAAKLNSDSLKGKVVFMNFWFEKCAPCMAEMEGLSDLYFTFKNNPDFKFMSFTFENAETIQRIRSKYDIDFPIYSISEKDCRTLNLNEGFPTNIVVDKTGIVRFFKMGGSTDKKIATKMIENKIHPVLTALLK